MTMKTTSLPCRQSAMLIDIERYLKNVIQILSLIV